jgi:hypothetical protein
MAGTRTAPKESESSKMYAWSNLNLGGKSEELKSGRKVITERNTVQAGAEVTLEKLGVTEEEYNDWVAAGVIRPYPYPEGYLDEDGNPSDAALGQSPYTYVLEKARAELEAAESDFEAESPEDRLLRASVAGSQVFGPNPEEVLMDVQLPEEVEEPTGSKTASKTEN